jgi:hypothetical protein
MKNSTLAIHGGKKTIEIPFSVYNSIGCEVINA